MVRRGFKGGLAWRVCAPLALAVLLGAGPLTTPTNGPLGPASADAATRGGSGTSAASDGSAKAERAASASRARYVATTRAAGSTGATRTSPTTLDAVTDPVTGAPAQGWTFDNGTGAWTAFGSDASATWTSSPVKAGAGALEVHRSGSGTGDVWTASGTNASDLLLATAGARYTARGYVRGDSVGRKVVMALVFRSSALQALATVWSQAVTDAPGTWTLTQPVAGIAPTGTALLQVAMIFYSTQGGETHYVDQISLTKATIAPKAVQGPLHSRGTHIYQANGKPVVLRGFTRDGTEISTSRFPSSEEIRQARGWGANFIRVPLNESLWLNTCATDPSDDPDYTSKVDAEVDSITSRGMVALLDLHFNVIEACGKAGPQAMADALFAPAFWAEVALRYKSDPLVAFDLYNEPHDISDQVWRNGGTATYAGQSFQAAGMQQLYTTVRAAGANNLVFVSGNDWANRPAATLVSGSNIVNAVHDYTCPESPPPTCSASNPYDAAMVMNYWAGVAGPVMITEAGFPDIYTGTFIQNLIKGAEARGWGWSIFSWGNSTDGPFSLLTSVGSTYEPAPSGIPVLMGLAKN